MAEGRRLAQLARLILTEGRAFSAIRYECPRGKIPMTFGPPVGVIRCGRLAGMNGDLSTADDLVVADLMTLEPIVVQVTAGIEEAEALMHDRAVSGLPVVDELGELVGVISRTDVVEDGTVAMSTLLRRRPSGLRVGELMTSPAVTVSPTTPLRDAARLMRDSRIHRLVAVDDAGRAVGVLSATDFVELYADG